MSARGVGIGGNKKGGGPRTVYVDNSFPIMKIALRKWVAEKFVNPSILDVYGGYGLMYKQFGGVIIILQQQAKHYLGFLIKKNLTMIFMTLTRTHRHMRRCR